jgi:uncharacterized membrane protein YqhA
MHAWLARSTWLVLIGVVGLLGTSVIAFVWGVAKTWSLAQTLLDDGSSSDQAVVLLLEAIDIYLTATVLIILAIGLFELFIKQIDLPGWLVINTLDDLKGKLLDILVIVLAIKFVEKLVSADEALDVLWYGIAVGIVGSLLVGLSMVKAKK